MKDPSLPKSYRPIIIIFLSGKTTVTSNGAQRKIAPSPVMYNVRHGSLLTDETLVGGRWIEHFQVLLNGRNERAIVRIQIGDGKHAIDPPTLKEVKTVITGLNNNKAGKAELPAKLFKHDSEQMYLILHRVIFKIWEKGGGNPH